MARKNTIRTSEHPYHITSRSNNQEWLYIPQEEVWSYFNLYLEEGKEKYGIIKHAVVLMSNHYHLLITTPEANIDQFMRFFNQSLGKAIARRANRINRIFGAPYKWNLIQRDSYYLNVLRYIYQNPVRAKLVERCEDYCYSDLKENRDELKIEWLNALPSIKEYESMRINLRRYVVSTDE